MDFLLIEPVIKSLKVAKKLSPTHGQIVAMNFSVDGKNLIACTQDDHILTYDINDGTIIGTIPSRKYGADLIHYTRKGSTAIHSSTKTDNDVRLLNLQANNYERYFKHSHKVISLSVEYSNDTFVSSSMDKKIRFWDPRTADLITYIRFSGNPYAVYGKNEHTLAVDVNLRNGHDLQIFDMRSMSKINSFRYDVDRDMKTVWSGLKYAPNGETIAVSTNGCYSLLIDESSGKILSVLSGYKNDYNLPIEVSFTPDSQYIFIGSSNGRIHIWNAYTGIKVCELSEGHKNPVQCLKFCPTMMLLASACSNMVFWLPVAEEGLVK